MKHDWEYKKLGDCFSYIKNGANIKQDKSRIGYPITRIETLSNGVFNRDKMGYAGITELGKYKANVLEDKDLLMSHINSKTYVGRTVVYDKQGDEKIIHGMNLLRLIPCNFIISSYFQYHTQSSYFKNCIARIRKDAVNQSSFAIGDLIRIPIPVPPLPIQQQIVDELDKLSEIIEKKKQQVKELDTLAQSIFYDMFGDPNINEKKWETKKLSNLCINLDSQRKPITAKDRVVGSFPYYGASGIVDYVEGYILDGEYLLVSEDGANLLLRHTPIAFVAKGKIWVNNHAHILEFDNKKLQSFVEYFFKYLDISHLITGCAQPKLTQGNLNNIEIFFPSNTLIDSFAQKIEAIEKQKELINQSIKETQLLFDSRMDYYFGE